VKRLALGVLVALGVAGLSALGIWQIERRAWKLALIERVEQRVHAAPVPAPGPSDWARINRDDFEYQRVSVSGHFIADKETLVRAVTDLGGGYWVLAPFQADRGFVVLVNRGFVPPEGKDPALRTTPSPGPTSITGLLRLTEPKGGFLRTNDPAQNQWYSRDVTAISHAQGLTDTAPYFIDAQSSNDAGARAPGQPVPGLTVISFHNSHLVYAITWFALALMVAAFGIRMARHR
jgi:surfeit locus 1 family protein